MNIYSKCIVHTFYLLDEKSCVHMKKNISFSVDTYLFQLLVD